MNGGRYTEDDHAERERLRVEVEGQVTPAPPPLLAFLSATRMHAWCCFQPHRHRSLHVHLIIISLQVRASLFLFLPAERLLLLNLCSLLVVASDFRCRKINRLPLLVGRRYLFHWFKFASVWMGIALFAPLVFLRLGSNHSASSGFGGSSSAWTKWTVSSAALLS